MPEDRDETKRGEEKSMSPSRRDFLRLGAVAGAGVPLAGLIGESAAKALDLPRLTDKAVRIEEAWRDLLQSRWGVPREAPPSRWRELLAGQGVEAEALDELDLLIEDLQYLRFAPQLSTTDALRADALARCRRLLRRLS